MTYEEIKEIRDKHPEKGVDNKELARMIDAAIERQIPKKPTFEDVGNVFGGILRICGACGDRVVISAKAMEFENYCRRCGVKLKEEGAESDD